MRNRLVVLGAVLLVVALVAAAVLGWRAWRTSELEQAVALAPASTERMTWTDWAAVRARLGSRVDASSDRAEVDAFLTDAYDEDLSQMSALVESTEALQESYGFSPASLDWELLAQSERGSAIIMRLPESADFDALADRLEELGYRRPESETGVWDGGADLIVGIGRLTPELQYLALDADQRLVVSSRTRAYADVAIRTATGATEGFDGLGGVVDAVEQPLAAAVYGGDVVCRNLAMGNADERDQAQADQLLARAGDVDPLTGFAMARMPGDTVRVAMSFADEDQARVNADSRARLAAGPAPGQGGDFAERFRLGRVAAEGDVVTMQLEPVRDSFVLSDLSNGPVLFATC